MTVVFFFTPALDSVYRRKRWQEFHLFMDEYRTMISYLTLMPNSFLVEGAFRHAAMERGRKAKLPVRNPWLMALSVRSFDLALIIQDMIRSGIIPDFDADDPPKE